jgi:superfamily II DNA or RNA helicase
MIRSSQTLIDINSISDIEYKELLNDLTLPNPTYQSILKYSKYGKVSSNIPKELYYYRIIHNKIEIPRNYYLPDGSIDNTVTGKRVKINFNAELRNYQNNFINGVDFNNNEDLIFNIPCGHGKTVMSLYVASLIKRATIIVVPTNYLIKQWFRSIIRFTGITPEILSNSLRYDKPEVLDRVMNASIYLLTYDMFNAIWDSSKLSKDILNKLLTERIGFTIFDELHRTGCETFSPIITKIPARRRLGLTATLRRTDGAEKIIKYHFGKVYKMENQFPKAKFIVINTGIKIRKIVPKKLMKKELLDFLDYYNVDYSETESYYNVHTDKVKDFDKLLRNSNLKINLKNLLLDSTSISHFDTYSATNESCIKIYKEVITKCLRSERTVLVLSKRKEILKSLHNYYKDIYSSALVISETNNQDDNSEKFLQEEAQIIFGVNQLAEYGLDIDRIDTLIYLHPVTDTEQSIGRVIRYVKDKKQPLVILPLHDCQVYFGIYKKSIKFVKINADLIEPIKVIELDKVLRKYEYSPYKNV